MNGKPCSKDSRVMHKGENTLAPGNPSPGPRDDSMKKYPCQDCNACQFCSDTRCRTCRGNGHGRAPRMSIQEQIDLYNKKNEGLL